MFKRAFWFGAGTVAGLGSSVYVQRRVKRAAAHLPDRVQQEVTGAARRVGRGVKAAATEGRAAMRVREAELRARVADRPGPGSGPADGDHREGPEASPVG